MESVFNQSIAAIRTYAALKRINKKSTLETSPKFAIICSEITQIMEKNDVEQCTYTVYPEESCLCIQMYMFELYTKNGRTDPFFSVIKDTAYFNVRKADEDTICIELNFPFQWV